MWKNLAYGQPTVSAPVAAPVTVAGTDVPTADVPTTVVGRLHNILTYLNSIKDHQPVTIQDIYQHTGIDLTIDEVADRLRNNPKVRVANDTFAYKAKYDIKDKDQLQHVLKRVNEGIPSSDLKDCYNGVEDDLRELSRAGHIICIKNTETGTEVYYARGFSFFTQVGALATVEGGSYVTTVNHDVTPELRRGDAVRVGDHWFRVSNAEKKGPMGNPPQPFTSIHPTVTNKSVSSMVDLNLTSKKTKYMLTFDAHHLPLDMPFPDHRHGHMHHPKWDLAPKFGKGAGTVALLKHGCTNDIRDLWRDTLRDWPTDRAALERKLVQSGLTTQANIDANRAKRKLHIKSKAKVARVKKQRDIKITNTHLIGTELGQVLAKGSEGSNDFTLGAVKFDRQ
ncbi:hypothetical protein SDRG_13115 [Saprolegnia diclina VS20]|uniref:TFIIE beta domain-containing protein n=1 Tax=Saprolegnia diclina (strain VS20) TaxID=1156394 RepID=T0RHF6_SAPDV|nr:hypothetical protein SDRG_13115 [Saprolegnia diclina VS20]EQC29242.1 hypothetical protein SDRG_13115 [Saprolegnia diclina VS20]|eukprot:XP_008617420.1 hypothetical protein SDRG_13115 [Saprolegnia diclina VS20]